MLCNSNLAYDNEVIKKIKEISDNILKYKGEKITWLTERLIFSVAVRCLALSSQNDYITFSFYQPEALSAALYQATIYILAESSTCEDFKKMWPLFASCTAMHFVSDCFRRDAEKPQRLRFFLQNMMRIFVFDFNADLASNFSRYNEASEYLNNIRTPEDLEKLCKNLMINQYEFLAPNAPNRREDTIVIDSMELFFKTLRNRVLLLEKDHIRHYLEKNFKVKFFI